MLSFLHISYVGKDTNFTHQFYRKSEIRPVGRFGGAVRGVHQSFVGIFGVVVPLSGIIFLSSRLVLGLVRM